MTRWKHFNFEQRKIIKQLLTYNKKLVEIANLLDKDPTSVSKEIQRHRIPMKKLYAYSERDCSKTKRYPYVCNGCELRYTCGNDRFKYDAKKAHEEAQFTLVTSRQGINLTQEEFDNLNSIVKAGVDNKESIYHIVQDNEDINVSVPTVYRYINNGLLKVKRIDLPQAVRLKKRKIHKKYEYKENNAIDRSGRTYLDYLTFIQVHPHLYPVQKDFLGGPKTDKKSLLVMSIPKIHYVLLFLIDRPNQAKIENIYNRLELTLLTENFQKIFPAILTDRDPCFFGFDSIETSILTNEKRTRIFYCDPLASIQKGNVEQANKQLRVHIPKETSLDIYTPEEIKNIENKINNHSD